MAISKIERRKKIKLRIRKRIIGTQESPRLSVFRSNKEIYAQIIDDLKGITLVAASSRDKEIKKEKGMTKTAIATEVGKLLAQRAKAKNISTIKFDRNGYLYHGRVKALAEGAREGGLTF